MVDIITSLQESDGEIIPVSDMNDLITKIHDILDKAVYKYALVMQLKV